MLLTKIYLYRFAYPEFLPDCDLKYRNHTRELLERRDMIARRENVMIPEFYVGSIVGVTLVNPPSQGPGTQREMIIIDFRNKAEQDFRSL